MLSDRHIHSNYSFDSRANPEESIQKAIRLGMTDLCFTDHCDVDLGENWILDVKSYTEGILALKEKYKNSIRVHVGIEMGLSTDHEKEIRGYLASYPFEYVIGSIHSLLGRDLYYRDKYPVDDKDFYRIYFETVLANLTLYGSQLDTLGHMDYVVRYGYEKAASYDPEEYEDLIGAILGRLIRGGIALELNTASLRKKLDFVHPHEFILEKYADLGGRYITFGSDAHFPDHVGAGLEEAQAIAEKYGFIEKKFRG